MATRSLRSRIVWGLLLWVVALMVVAHLMVYALLRHFPHVPAIAHWTTIAFVAAGFMAAGLAQLRRGMSPLGQLRARLAAVREGRDTRIAGSYPSEVQPLVDDLNALLEHREHAVARAQQKAGDLAHGLKTSLAVLAQDAERVRAQGHAELATRIGQQVERMRRHVEYQLAAARAAASGATLGTRCQVAAAAERLARTLRRLHVERALAIELNVPADHAVRVQSEDLDEMLGNVLDNACHWTRSRCVVTSAKSGPMIVITVDDDGPGLEPALRDRVLNRGVRADEAAPGSGLGLAIVRELAQIYGGSIALVDSPLGGLRAQLVLPGA